MWCVLGHSIAVWRWATANATCLAAIVTIRTIGGVQGRRIAVKVDLLNSRVPLTLSSCLLIVAVLLRILPIDIVNRSDCPALWHGNPPS